MCIFCEKFKTQDKILLQNEFAFAILDAFPVSEAHTLIIPVRHVKSFFALTPKEMAGMHTLAKELKGFYRYVTKPQGYTIGFNEGKIAGQSIMHCHMHFIPRYKGDVKNPRGGIRGVIPGKQNY